MQQIIDFFTKNLEWLFSGVGVVALSFFVRQIWNRFHPLAQRSSKTEITHVTNIINGADPTSTIEENAYKKVTIERAYLTKRIGAGDYFDLARDKTRKIRVTISSIDTIVDKTSISNDDANIIAATMKIDLGGSILYGGERTEMVGVNTFRIPQVKGDEAKSGVFSFYNTNEYTSFVRILVEHINKHTAEVDINILHVVGIFE